ncbi:hypothetical protein NDU88_005186 [Pleurodeles waltl]|uniref:Uncharacterized protein n=1 Tax=Pleurodeles waltl TaxID=8319 RepID=A0AAV7RLD9_PLEWA|nr:hypothetical protein NDU88_005186 [Pleurodeles waltl]
MAAALGTQLRSDETAELPNWAPQTRTPTPHAELGKKSWHDPENKRSSKEEQQNKCKIQVRVQSRADQVADARDKQRINAETAGCTAND